MLPRLKTSSNKATASMMSAWHPNFRKPELLPDTKVVRTSFFINVAAILIVLGLLAYLTSSEIKIRNIQEQIGFWQRQIDAEKPGSDKAIIQFKKFQDEEKQLFELKAFQSNKIVGSELLLELGNSLPPRITLIKVDYHGDNLIITGIISGTSDEASGDASAYLDVLNAYPYFAGKFEKASLVGITRNPSTNGINFEILLKFKPELKGGKK